MSLNSMASNKTGLPLEQDDIAEVKIAVNAAREAAAVSLAKERGDLCVGGAGFAGQRKDVVTRKDTRMFLKSVGMFVDIAAERVDP